MALQPVEPADDSANVTLAAWWPPTDCFIRTGSPTSCALNASAHPHPHHLHHHPLPPATSPVPV